MNTSIEYQTLMNAAMKVYDKALTALDAGDRAVYAALWAVADEIRADAESAAARHAAQPAQVAELSLDELLRSLDAISIDVDDPIRDMIEDDARRAAESGPESGPAIASIADVMRRAEMLHNRQDARIDVEMFTDLYPFTCAVCGSDTGFAYDIVIPREIDESYDCCAICGAAQFTPVVEEIE